MKFQYYICLTTIILLKVLEIKAHGRLVDPPARSTAWREKPSLFPPYYDDMQMWCGGFDVQWNKNGGKCGICGEEYFQTKRFEKGGDLYRGYVVRSYSLNSVIKVDVEVTANHKGWFEFRLCNIDNMNEATQDCLDKTLLKDSMGNSRFDWPKLGIQGHFFQDLIIPNNFQCNRCVFQWKYNTGNNWGNDFQTGVSCLGCGPQEQFYGCADISIGNGPTTKQPTVITTKQPTVITTKQPTVITTKQPTVITTKKPTVITTKQPTVITTKKPTVITTKKPTVITTKQPTVTTTTTPTTQEETTFTCVKDGLFAFNYCTQYYQCVFTNTPYAFKVLQNCPSGTLFDQSIQVCNWESQVNCGNVL